MDNDSSKTNSYYPTLGRAEFEIIYKAIADAVIVADTNRYIKYINPAANKLFGYQLADLTGYTTEILYADPKAYAAQGKRIYSVQAASDLSAPFEVEYRHADGSTFIGETIGGKLRSEDGEVVAYIGIIRDVSQRKQYEAALAESEQRYRTLLEHAPEAIVVFDIERGEFVDANENAVRLFACERETLLKMTPFDLSPPRQPDGRNSTELAKYYMNQALNGDAPVFEWIHRTTTGRDIPCEVRLVKLRAGGRNYIRGSITDISDRRRAEQALRESEKKYKQLIELAQEGIWVIDNNNITTFVNPSMAAMLDYTVEEMCGRRLHSFMDEKGVELCQANLTKGRQGLAEQHDFELLTKSGRRIYVAMATTSITDDTGKRVGTIAGVLDITARKEAQDALQRHQEQLEDLVTERSRELEEAHEELLKNQRLATLGQLIATIGHELRNPLGSIQSSVHALDRKLNPGDETIQRVIRRIKRNIIRCDHIIDDLLGYARSADIEPGPVAIDSWLDELLNEQSMPETIQLRFEPGIAAELSIDTERMRRAVINLVDNARHAIEINPHKDNRAQEILVKTWQEAGMAKIAVSDTGTGIADDVLPNVFEPLYSTKTFGAGLGLPTVTQIMEQHHGSVDIETSTGKGTTVTLSLPM
jgi:PAS domain S-box-containing protein